MIVQMSSFVIDPCAIIQFPWNGIFPSIVVVVVVVVVVIIIIIIIITIIALLLLLLLLTLLISWGSTLTTGLLLCKTAIRLISGRLSPMGVALDQQCDPLRFFKCWYLYPYLACHVTKTKKNA